MGYLAVPRPHTSRLLNTWAENGRSNYTSEHLERTRRLIDDVSQAPENTSVDILRSGTLLSEDEKDTR